MKNNLAEIREGKGLSQLRLSYLTGIQPTEISRIETAGKGAITLTIDHFLIYPPFGRGFHEPAPTEH